MPYLFETIGLIGKYGDPGVADTLAQIADFLRQAGRQVLLDEDTAQLTAAQGVDVATRREIGRRAELAIVVGGDGTLLNAARSLVDFQVPIVGVNLGRLGFLTDVSPAEIPAGLDAILQGRYHEENRALLHAQVRRGEQVISEADALNDVVVHKRDVARMVELDTFLDGQLLNAYRADGLIIATPTGSTAYALSGGGPILHPTLEAFVVVPICPHTLTHRPIVIGADSDIEIVVRGRNTTQTQITCDGQISLPIEPGDRIVIRRKRRQLRLLHPLNHDYYELLRAKLRWGVNPEGTEFNR
ncbi:NAD(+) kinase [Plasticicumulans acidivorans]|uniref:NAD kinase n=1 Tax=Plasticicumulans acidivorans TaxID=886464 RepID=A0A317MTV5_9GAMM|nr:NAD(+) kinase [Plasticicumulans acidivorans]PWV60492.1 NAD+ kinase [Plasticicumulans acidivorans]